MTVETQNTSELCKNC